MLLPTEAIFPFLIRSEALHFGMVNRDMLKEYQRNKKLVPQLVTLNKRRVTIHYLGTVVTPFKVEQVTYERFDPRKVPKMRKLLHNSQIRSFNQRYGKQAKSIYRIYLSNSHGDRMSVDIDKKDVNYLNEIYWLAKHLEHLAKLDEMARLNRLIEAARTTELARRTQSKIFPVRGSTAPTYPWKK